MGNYTIKQNDYVAPKVREEVVQRLLNFYHDSIGTCDCIFNISGHCQTYGLVCEKQTNGKWEDVLYRNTCVPYYETKDKAVVTTEEMQEFVREWIKAGYFVSRGIDDKWGYVQYRFTKSPFTMYGFKVVTEFKDTIHS